MSGGCLCDYQQYRLFDMAERIKEEIARNNEQDGCPDEFWDGQRYTDETIAEFKKGIEALRIAYVYAQRIDWLISGDDGEEQFHKRLKDDLETTKWDEL